MHMQESIHFTSIFQRARSYRENHIRVNNDDVDGTTQLVR